MRCIGCTCEHANVVALFAADAVRSWMHRVLGLVAVARPRRQRRLRMARLDHAGAG